MIKFFQVWAKQHFEEISIVDNILVLFPAKGKSVMKGLVDQIQMINTDTLDQVKVSFQVVQNSDLESFLNILQTEMVLLATLGIYPIAQKVFTNRKLDEGGFKIQM